MIKPFPAATDEEKKIYGWQLSTKALEAVTREASDEIYPISDENVELVVLALQKLGYLTIGDSDGKRG